jgi:hypothetical protein
MAIQGHPKDTVCCARCGHTCSIEAWSRLPRQQTLTRTELVGCVSGWPVDAVVDVRPCAGCGGLIARRRRAPSASDTRRAKASL